MKIEREHLLATLEAVQPGLSSSGDIEQSQTFVFLGDRVMTYNDEVSVSCPIETDFKGAVKGEEMVKLLGKLKEKEVEVEITDGELHVKGGKVRAGIRLEAEITLPLEEVKPPSDPKAWTPLPEKFAEGLRFCQFSASTDKGKPVLNCIQVSGQHVVSCDNFRLTRYDLGKTKAFPRDLLVPAKTVPTLLGYNPETYAAVGGWLHFRMASGLVFSCRTFEEAYPKTEQLLNVEGDEVEFPEEMKDILSRAEVFAKGKAGTDSRIEVAFKGSEMMVTGRGEWGWLKEKAKVAKGSTSARFLINPVFLSDILGLLRTVTIGDRMIKLTGENFAHVATLLAAE